MKILHLIYDHTANPWVGGGGAVRAYELCKRLARSGHLITVVSGKYPGATDYTEGNLSYRFLGSSRNYILSTFSYAIGAAGFVRSHGEEFDIVVEDFAPWNPVFSRFFTSRPAVLHVNHKESLNILKRWFVLGIPFFITEVFYPRLFRDVTALSEETKRKLNMPDALVVPAGIDGSLLGETAEEEGDYILYIGRLHIKNKGLDTLIEAMKTLKGARLIIVGRGRDAERLKSMAKGLKAEFTGFLEEAEKIKTLKGAKLLVLPSRFEGWGIAALEAAAMGKPVIASDIPELGYIVSGGFGLSFKTGNAKDLAGKITLLLGDDNLRREMGQKAVEYAKAHTWDEIALGYEKYLLDVIKTSGRK